MTCGVFGNLLVLATALFVTNGQSKFGTWPDICLDNRDKGVPSRETEPLPACQEYKDFSCCSVEATLGLQENGTLGMQEINPSCGDFSPECAKYHVALGCVYECEPMLQHFRNPAIGAWPYKAPVCASYCHEWFEACKDDLTCIGNWEEAYLDPYFYCPYNGSTCVTHTEMYGNGRVMCETIYPSAIVYVESDTDCMVGLFSGENPNLHGDPYGKNSAKKITVSLLPLLLFCFHF